jgi:hypothetical protein
MALHSRESIGVLRHRRRDTVRRQVWFSGILLAVCLFGCAPHAAPAATRGPVIKETVIVAKPTSALPPTAAPVPPTAAPAPIISGASADFPLTQKSLPCQKVVDQASGQVSLECDGDLLAAERGEMQAYQDQFGKLSPDLVQVLREPQPSTRNAVPVAIWLLAPLSDELEQEYLEFRLATGQDLSLDEIRSRRDELLQKMSAVYGRAEDEAISVLASYGCWLQSSYASSAAPLLYTELPLDGKHGVYSALQALPSVDAVYPAGMGEPKLDSAVATIEASEVWARKDATGKGAGLYLVGLGVKIAIVESGRIDFSNPGFSGDRIFSTRDLSVATDGHKTRVAAVAATSDYTLTGVAPRAALLSADCATFGEADVVAAIDWAIADGADVLNASFGLPAACDKGTDNAFSRYFDFVSFRHMRATTAAAGNESDLAAGRFQYVCSPALGYNVVAVGGITDSNTAAWGDDAMYNRSNVKNPISTFGDRRKPEVCAVAESITTPGFDASSGTSYAAPAVAGIVALLIQREPWLVKWPEATKAVLMVSAVHNVTGTARLDDWEGAGTVVASEADRVVDRDWVRCNIVTTDTLPLKIPFSADKGETVRFAIAWSSHAEKKDKLVSNALEADLDLVVFDPAGTKVAQSLCFDNSYEIVEFTAEVTGTYKAQVDQMRFETTFECVAAAWHRR